MNYCDDCGAKAGLPIDQRKKDAPRVPGYYGKCPRCGIIRVCYGEDPEPQKPRRPPIPAAVKDWQRQREYERKYRR